MTAPKAGRTVWPAAERKTASNGTSPQMMILTRRWIYLATAPTIVVRGNPTGPIGFGP